MRYLGGKSRIAKPIAEVINKVLRRKKSDCFVSLFCGACSIESKVNAKTMILNDSHKYLIEMYNEVLQGYCLPDVVLESEYAEIKSNKDKDRALTGFVGFACSFGGKWFGGYARNNSNRNYCLEAKKGLLKKIEPLKNATFYCNDYRNIDIPENAVVYCDPPYNNTTGYSNGKFDTSKFWEYARKLSKTNIVLVSEEYAPQDFVSIWEKTFTRTLDVNKSNQPKKIEKLFIHKDNLHYIHEDLRCLKQ